MMTRLLSTKAVLIPSTLFIPELPEMSTCLSLILVMSFNEFTTMLNIIVWTVASILLFIIIIVVSITIS
jgi:hypothetical protein